MHFNQQFEATAGSFGRNLQAEQPLIYECSDEDDEGVLRMDGCSDG